MEEERVGLLRSVNSVGGVVASLPSPSCGYGSLSSEEEEGGSSSSASGDPQPPPDETDRPTSWWGDNIRSIMFGGLDGISTVFVSVATVFGGDMLIKTLLIIGLAKLLSGAISMGTGDYFGTKADIEMLRSEKLRERWECENNMPGEREEMCQIYEDKGLSRETARQVVSIFSQEPAKFVEVMMVEELGYAEGTEDESPWKNGLITFFSFLVLGSIPLLSYVAFLIAHGGDVNEKINSDEFWVAAGLTVLTLLIVGAIKSRLESQRWWVSALFTLLIGAGSAGSGFLVAFILQSATGTTGG